MEDFPPLDTSEHRPVRNRTHCSRHIHVWVLADGPAIWSAVLSSRGWNIPARCRGVCCQCCKAPPFLPFPPLSFPSISFPFSTINVVLQLTLTTLQTRFPERLKPGLFDIWGSSHQIFHILVVIATIVHLIGVLTAFDYNYEHRQCTVHYSERS